MAAPTKGFDATANRIGALALMLSDRMSDAITDVAATSVSAATALSAIHHFLDAPTIDRLRQVLGLTSSGTVRLVDQLERDGYAKRAPAMDARSTSIVLTAAGRRAAGRVSSARAAVLDDALGPLSDDERRALDGLASRMLVGLMRGPGAVRWMCRLCDTRTCGHDTGDCPVTKAASERAAEEWG